MSLHVECGIVRTVGSSIMPVEVGDGLLWSNTLDVPHQVSEAAPAAPPGGSSAVVLTLTAEVDMWVVIDRNPSSQLLPKRLMKAGSTRSFLAPPGVAVAWEAV